jgi:hypothetical protein
MTIDEAIDYAKDQQEIFGGKHKEFLTNVAGWLEELKNLKPSKKGFITIGQTVEEFEEKIRENAINDFANWLYENHKTDLTEYIEWYFGEITEQLKAGGKNENYNQK